MEISKNDIYLLKQLVLDIEEIPYKTCEDLAIKYFTSRANLYKLLKKMGFESYTDFQYSIRFRQGNEQCENCIKDSVFVLCKKLNDIIKSEYTKMEDKYFDIYNIYCDIEELVSNPLSDRLYDELLSLLYGSMELFDVEDKTLKFNIFNKLIDSELVLLSL